MATVTWLVFAYMVAGMFVLAYYDHPPDSRRMGPKIEVSNFAKEMR